MNISFSPTFFHPVVFTTVWQKQFHKSIIRGAGKSSLKVSTTTLISFYVELFSFIYLLKCL